MVLIRGIKKGNKNEDKNAMDTNITVVVDEIKIILIVIFEK